MSLASAVPSNAVLVFEVPGSNPESLTVSGQHLYFVADDGVHGRELWRIDQSDRASLVVDVVPGPESGEPHHLQNVGGKLYFFSKNNELWVSEGSPLRTYRVATGPFQPDATIGVSEYLLFSATTNEHGRELWTSDGTPESARILVEGVEGPGNSIESWQGNLVHFNDRVYFALMAGSEGSHVWSTDGTQEGTAPVHDRDGNRIPTPGGAFEGIVIDNTLYFTALGSPFAFYALEADAAAPTKIPIPHNRQLINQRQLGQAGRTLLFQGSSEAHGAELWSVDTVTREAKLLKDINTGIPHSGPYEHRALGRWSVFIADHQAHGVELWRTDGTTEGTDLLAELVEGAQSGEPYQLTVYKDWVLFSCENYEIGEELWRTDGTPEGTVLVRDINPEGDAEPYYLTPFNDHVYFAANSNDQGVELWKSDGTTEGTVVACRLKPSVQVIGHSNPQNLTPFHGRLVFTAEDSPRNRQVWITTEHGAEPFNAVNDALPDSAKILDIVVNAANLYVAIEDSDGNTESWRYSQTDESMQPVSEIPTSTEPLPPDALQSAIKSMSGSNHNPQPSEWKRIGDNILFAFYSPETGNELWRLNPTGDAELVLDIFPGPASSSPSEFVAFDSGLLFRAEDPNKGAEAWVTDGTAEGTRVIADFNPSPQGSMPTELTKGPNNSGFMVGMANATGVHLLSASAPNFRTEAQWLNKWQERVMRPTQLTVVDQTLYFVSNHPLWGKELWKTGSLRDTHGQPPHSRAEVVDDIASNRILE